MSYISCDSRSVARKLRAESPGNVFDCDICFQTVILTARCKAGLYDRQKICTNNLGIISYSKQVGGLDMKFIKLILAILGLIFGVMLFFCLFGLITSLLWYGFWIGLLAAVGYGGGRAFQKGGGKKIGSGVRVGGISQRALTHS